MKFNEPLGLPQGSVRAIITILLILGVLGTAFTGFQSDLLASLASAAFGYYFGLRTTESATTPRAESEVIVEPTQGEEEDPGIVVSGDQL